MAITRQKKEEIVAQVSNVIKSAKTLVFANFKGLTVAEQNEMRKALRPLGVGYTVAKKSLMRRALDAAKYTGEAPVLDGEIALAYGEDELAPARERAVFVKKFGEHLAFGGGVFGASTSAKMRLPLSPRFRGWTRCAPSLYSLLTRHCKGLQSSCMRKQKSRAS